MQEQQQSSPSLSWPQQSPTMPKLSDAQLKQYLKDGFIVVPGLVSPAELDELKREFVDIAKGKYQPSNIEPLPESMPDVEVLKSVLAIHMPHYISPCIRRYLAHPRITPILGQLTGAHLGEWWDGGVKACQSQLFVKPPGFQGQAWHQDEQYIPTRDRSLTAIWIAIDPVTAANGSLRVLPGSHRRGILFPQRERTDDDEYDFSKEA
jgi:phytanoyl-CoA hydroxylase